MLEITAYVHLNVLQSRALLLASGSIVRKTSGKTYLDGAVRRDTQYAELKTPAEVLFSNKDADVSTYGSLDSMTFVTLSAVETCIETRKESFAITQCRDETIAR